MSNKFITVDGKKIPLYHNHPPHINVSSFATVRQCYKLVKEHPWLQDVKMYEKPDLNDSLIEIDQENFVIELSPYLLQQPIDFQRDIFIHAICYWLSVKLFNDRAYGKPYKLLLERYSTPSGKETVLTKGVKYEKGGSFTPT